MTTSKQISPGGKIMSKKKFRGMIRGRAQEILDVLFESLHSKNPSLRLGAAKILINKILPDLKATEISSKAGQGIKVIFEDYGGNKNNPPTTTEGSTTNQ